MANASGHQPYMTSKLYMNYNLDNMFIHRYIMLFGLGSRCILNTLEVGAWRRVRRTRRSGALGALGARLKPVPSTELESIH